MALTVLGLASLGLASLGLAVLTSSCSSDSAQALPEGAERARAMERRVQELDQEFRALPTKSPEQFAAHTQIQQKIQALKIIFRSKERSGLGQITEDRFRTLSEQIGEIESLIRAFPR